jgi:hypothetical protein
MSSEAEPRRRALHAKREALRAQQAGRMAQQQRAQEMAAFQRHTGGALQAAGVHCELLWPEDTGRRGPLPTYPIGLASIHWPLVPAAVSAYGGTGNALKALFDEALRALQIAPATTVIADWCIGGMPRVALSAADASTHAIALMHASSDLWVYAADATWVIEVYHEGTLTYADRPGSPEHAGDGWRSRKGSPQDGHAGSS